ncbi:MAG TPA: class IIb bacteriocin, lactobin A/cerein 7B family [Longimicrobiaceae bacterium]|jgi:lactobin A/cerein 7B family class IIb bacteriocin
MTKLSVNGLVEMDAQEMAETSGGLIPLLWVAGAAGTALVAGAGAAYMVVKEYYEEKESDRTCQV